MKIQSPLKNQIPNFDPPSVRGNRSSGRVLTGLTAGLIGLLISWTGTQVFAQPAARANANQASTKPAAGQIKSTDQTEPTDRPRYQSVKLAEKPAVAKRSWESRPYQVAVWICHRGQPKYAAIEQQLVEGIESYCQLQDPSSWFVTAGTPPGPRRHELFRYFDQPEKCGDLQSDPELQFYDKLMVVRISSENGLSKILVREHDLQTGQWGPIIDSQTATANELAPTIAAGIRRAFMPVAIIDRVDEEANVYIRARALESCIRVNFISDTETETLPIKTSPVYIRQDDMFLPIIRKTDRSGNLKSLDAIPFTFLTIDSFDDSVIVASIQSKERATATPLSNRKSKRSQKLAVVVRPAVRSSILHIQSNEKEPIPLEGYEVWSRNPNDSKEVESEFLGKTDWRGNIEIPPSTKSNLRLIFVKRGGRARRLPVIPGFRDRLVAQLPNDNARLFAEGVIRGYQNDLINLVVQRELIERDIEDAVSEANFEYANERLQQYKELETPADLKVRMSNEEIRLKSLAATKREYGFIERMFSDLKKLLNTKVANSKAIELQDEIQNKILASGEKSP